MIGKLFLSFSLITTTCYAQSATITQIKCRPDPKYYNVQDSTIRYPLIHTKNGAVSKIINNQIRNSVLFDSDGIMAIQKALAKEVKNGLTNLDYEVTYNEHALLSITIFREGCGAHCSTENMYFNFDLLTGRKLRGNHLFSEGHFEEIKKKVLADKQDSLKRYKTDISKELSKGEVDSADYDWAINIVNEDCMHSVNMDNIIITKQYIEFADECQFAYAIWAMEPTYNLKYDIDSIKEFLSPFLLLRLKK